jgi:hypothetical protein
MADDGTAAAAATGGTDAAAAAAQAGAAGAGAQAAAGDAGQGAAQLNWKNIGIPSHMLKETPEDTLAEVFKGYKGYRDKEAERGSVGKSADDYKFEFADELKPFFPNGDDPALKAFQSVAHKHGLPVKLANTIINEVFAPLAKEGKLPQPFNPKVEMDGIAALLGKSGAEAAPAIEQATTEMLAWTANLGQQLKLSDKAQVELESLALTSSGFELLRALQGGGGDGFRLGGSTPGVLSRADLEAMQSDPRFSPDSPKYDKAFRQRYETAWRNLPADQLRR